MSSRITVALAATFAFGTAAQAAVIDFNDPAVQGQPISSVSSTDGSVNASITATGGIAQALVFDTTTINSADRDLQDPFRLPDGSVTGVRPGGVLIIQENADLIPDDNASGGTITFDFDTAINFTSFRIFDGATITVSSSDSTFTFEGFVPEPINENVGNRFFGEFDVTGLFNNVNDLTFTFSGSGAIDDLEVSPVPLPAALTLMLAGLGGLGAVGARRRRKTAA
jgi:hypothetical protein